MADSFHDRMQHLIDSVGAPGSVVAKVEISQLYAKYQELREDLNHPRGGQVHALRDSVIQDIDAINQTWAEGLLTEDGSGLHKAGEKIAERVSDRYEVLAPLEFNDLRRSGHPTVEDDGAVVYDRAPKQHRLSEDELRAKGELRRNGFRDSGHFRDEAGV